MLLKTLTLSGFKANKATYIGLVVLITLMAATLTFALCLNANVSNREYQAQAEAQAGDVYLYSQKSELTDSFVDEIAALDKVDRAKVTEAICAPTSYRNEQNESIGAENVLNVGYQPWGEAISFNAFESDQGKLSLIPHDQDQGPELGEIYVPIGTQATLGLQIGDCVLVAIGDEEFVFTISKYFEDPQLGSPFVEMGQYLVSDEDFDRMNAKVESASVSASTAMQLVGAEMGHPMRTLNIYMTEDARAQGMTPSGFADYIDEHVKTDPLTTGFLNSDMLAGYSLLVITIICAILIVFALLMFIIALVISIHTVSSSIQENFSNYAILKAVGVTNAMLRRSLAIQYILCAIGGCVLGTLIGALLLPLILPLFAILTGVLAQANALVLPLYAALVVLVIAIAFIVYVKTKRVSRISPLAALRSGIEDVHFSSTMSASVAGRPLILRLAWRALTSAKKNYVGLFICALFLASFVMLTFGIGSSIKTMDDAYESFGVWKSDLSVQLSDDVSIEDVEDALADTTPVGLIWQEGMTMQNIEGESRTIVGLSDFSILSGVAEGSVPAYDNEIVVGYNLAEEEGLSIGDEFTLRNADGSEQDFLVSGLMSAMLNAGYGMVITYDALDDIRGEDASAGNDYQIRLEDPQQAEQAKQLLEERFAGGIEMNETALFESTKDLMILIHDLFVNAGYGMDLVAVLLVVLSVSLIIRRMFDMERHDLGVYRALGFKSSSLRLQFALRFLIVSIVGCIVGAILVSLGGSWLTSQLFGLFGVSKFMIDTSPLLIGGISCALALVFFVAAYWSARKVQKIPTTILITE